MMSGTRQPVVTLTVSHGPGAGRRFFIGAVAVTIGRHAQCDVHVDYPWVSRRHARIAWSGTEYTVEDLDSTNGTYVNGERVVGPRALKSGVLLQLGEQPQLALQVRVSAPWHEVPVPPRKEKHNPRLRVLSGEMKGQEYPLDDEATSVGRNESNRIVMRHDAKVSRNHCRILTHLGFVWLEDLKSHNGTYLTRSEAPPVRLTPFQPALLFDGSTIQIGAAEFQVLDILVHRNDAVGLIGMQLQKILRDIRKALPDMSAQRRRACEATPWELELRLRQATSEQELIALVTESIQKLSASFLRGKQDGATIVSEPALELPPLPESLPDVDCLSRVDSIRNMFISDIRHCLPPDERSPDDTL
jgi:pSer/pThr/pTyr-binding forkhead associated (FHA) protein